MSGQRIKSSTSRWALLIAAVALVDATLAEAQDAGAVDAGTTAETEQVPQGHEPQLSVTLEPQEEAVRQVTHLTLAASVPEGDDVTLPAQGFAS